MGLGVKCCDAFPQVTAAFESFAQVAAARRSELRHLSPGPWPAVISLLGRPATRE